MIEVLLGVEPVLQPQPYRNPGGDCFACALTAALRWVYRKPDLDFDACWNLFRYENGSGVTNTWPGMRKALYAADWAFREIARLEIRSDVLTPHFDAEMFSHAWFSFYPISGYAERLEGWLRSGYVALCEISFAGGGPVVGGGWNTTDHFVLVDGVRTFWKRLESGGGTLEHEVHVVCSAKGAYWLPLSKWLFDHGGAGWWLVRREER